MPLNPEVALDVALSAICSRNRYSSDPQAVLRELRQMAGTRTEILAMVAGTWSGYFDDEHTRALAAALRELPGAERWVELGRQRRGTLNSGSTPLPPIQRPSPE